MIYWIFIWKNDGRCFDNNGTQKFVCQCIGGFQGTTCEFDLCKETECKNGGECIASINDANVMKPTCNCLTGFIGSDCSDHVCDNITCKNGGECTVDETDLDQLKAECHCPDVYYGDECQNLSGCEGKPCQNDGECQLAVNSTLKDCFTYDTWK